MDNDNIHQGRQSVPSGFTVVGNLQDALKFSAALQEHLKNKKEIYMPTDNMNYIEFDGVLADSIEEYGDILFKKWRNDQNGNDYYIAVYKQGEYYYCVTSREHNKSIHQATLPESAYAWLCERVEIELDEVLDEHDRDHIKFGVKAYQYQENRVKKENG